MKEKMKKITYISIISAIVVITVLIIAMIININKMYSDYKEQATLIKENSLSYFEEEENLEEASSSIGKTVEESKESEEIQENVENIAENETIVEEKTTKEDDTTVTTVIPDPNFISPVDGEIIKEYSKENLVYSETLKEWTTHMGIDIQAELTSVVKSAEEGVVKAIKNDPRYGLTVIIEHVNGFETRYSNLLTAEFVIVGEKVSKGQTIGTVGNTASFEIIDSSHLHFEILQNSEYLDPTVYIY